MYWIRIYRFKNMGEFTLTPMIEKPDGINVSKREAIEFTNCMMWKLQNLKKKNVCTPNKTLPFFSFHYYKIAIVYITIFQTVSFGYIIRKTLICTDN